MRKRPDLPACAALTLLAFSLAKTRQLMLARSPMRLILLGKPGSGKGTQARRIAEREKIPAIATGDLIRAAIAQKTALGQEFHSYTSRGKLVPDELVVAMVTERLAEADCSAGYLLDGFPRTIVQAEALDRILADKETPLDVVLNLAVPDGVLVERAVGRRSCAKDGSSYHVKFAPPRNEGKCDVCGGPLLQRDDDREQVVASRLQEYAAKTAPLIEYYQKRGLLREVDGVGTLEKVQELLEQALGWAK